GGTGAGGHAVTQPDARAEPAASPRAQSAPSPLARSAPSPQGGGEKSAEISIAGVTVVADPAGALYWPREGLLVIADLHIEKGSSFAARGVLLPPYDTAETLARLAGVMAHYAPRAVIALGDSFHDGDGPARLAPDDRAALRELQRGRDWFWVAGNAE